MGIFSQTNSFEKFIKDTNENVSFVLKMEELNPYLDKWGEEMLTKFIKRIIVVENYYKGNMVAIYVKGEVAGYAIHLVQK